MELQQALDTLHESLPPEASYSVRFARTVHSVEDFGRHSHARTGRHREQENWIVTVLLRRDSATYLEATENADLARAVAEAVDGLRSWSSAAQSKPPKLVAPSRAADHAADAAQARVVS